MINYYRDEWLERKVKHIVETLNLNHVKLGQVYCFRSVGSNSRRVIARCWALPRIFQNALNAPPSYCLEVISERFDKLSEDEKEKVLIHELLHLPKSFGGGIKPHSYVNKQRVNHYHKKYVERKKKQEKNNWR